MRGRVKSLFIHSANLQDDSKALREELNTRDSKYISQQIIKGQSRYFVSAKADNILTRVSTYRYSSDCQGCDLKAPHCLCRAHWDRFLSVLSLRATSGGREWNEIYLYRLCEDS